MNTGGKYDSLAFKKSVGLNGVGTKAVNALSNYSCGISSWWETFAEILLEEEVIDTTKRKGTKVTFIPMKLF
jgi:topoisomerase-4 subunit B